MAVDLQNLLDESDAMAAYSDPVWLETCEDDEIRLTLQSVYFYRRDLFAEDLLTRWTSDKATGNRIASAPFHREIWKLEGERKDALYILPRDHAKTTAGTKICTLHDLLYSLEKSVIFVMSKGLGESVVGDIRKELETNHAIRWIYGQMVPIESKSAFKTEKWRQRELQLLNGTELRALTKGEPVRGHRPTKIRVDDPQEKKDVKNPIIANEFWDWFWTSVYPALDPAGSVSVFGTLISDNCFINQLKQEAIQRKFKVIECPAILNFNEAEFTGMPLWPEKWSLVDLKERCQKIGRREFLQEYQNIPFVSNGSPVFDPAYTYKIIQPIETKDGVAFYRSMLGPASEKIYAGFIGIDLASGAIGGDYSTITCRDHEMRLLAQYRGYITQDRLAGVVDKIAQLCKDVLIIPENNMGLAFLDACKKYDWHRKIYRTKTMDKITNKQSDVLGFNTNAKTKPLIINGLDQVFRAGDFEVSKDEFDEIQHYYHDERGGMNAVSPWHDDLLISDALSIHGIKQGLKAPLLVVL